MDSRIISYMDMQQSKNQSKSYPITNISIYSGKICNVPCKDGDEVSSTTITDSPGSAWFDKKGKVLCALQSIYKKYRLLRRSGGLCIQEFFRSYAILS